MGTWLHILDNMDESLYSRRANLVIGFHGCDRSVVENVISTNDYDWLGSGIYFWENNEERAWQWAVTTQHPYGHE